MEAEVDESAAAAPRAAAPPSLLPAAAATAEAVYQRPQPSGIEDPVLRELVKDELKLRKKLREIDTLAAKPRGTLDAAQQKKVQRARHSPRSTKATTFQLIVHLGDGLNTIL